MNYVVKVVTRKQLEKILPGLVSDKKLIAKLAKMGVTYEYFNRKTHKTRDYKVGQRYVVRICDGELQVQVDKARHNSGHFEYSVKLETVLGRPHKFNIEQIIFGAGDLEDGEIGMHGCLDSFCEQNGIDDATKELAGRTYFRQSARDAGIPLSVIEGKTKLSDHFPQDEDECLLDKNDPKHPDFAENMRDAADILRKERRENGL